MIKNKMCDLRPETVEKIKDAVNNVLNGNCTKVDVTRCVKVYQCKNVVRIDLKIMGAPEEF